MFVPEYQIDYQSALVQIMTWHQTDDKQLSEPIMVYFTDTYMYASLGLSELMYLFFMDICQTSKS